MPDAWMPLNDPRVPLWLLRSVATGDDGEPEAVRRVAQRALDLRSAECVADTDVRMSEAAKNWIVAIDRVYAERVREVLSGTHKLSMT